MLRSKSGKIILFVTTGLFIIAALVCFIYANHICTMLESQYEAERWQGDTGTEFSQLSCFVPADGKLQISDINSFRTKALTKLSEASAELESGKAPFIDCWSCESSAKVYGMYSGTADIIACGGSFFEFHPLKLVTGNYFSGDDLMQDNVLLDEDLAWLLFGGNDLEGQFVYIFNTPFRVAGVVAREDDQATEKAYSGGLGLFMSYDAFRDLSSGDSASQPAANAAAQQGNGMAASSAESDAGITCYEICMPNPVDGFARGVLESEFPIGAGEIVENTGRFGALKLFKIAKDFSVRSIHSGVTYSYWENAARYAENKAAILVVIGAFCALFPEILILVLLIRNLIWTNTKLAEDILPAFSEKVQESVRVRERAAWERRHNYVPKNSEASDEKE